MTMTGTGDASGGARPALLRGRGDRDPHRTSRAAMDAATASMNRVLAALGRSFDVARSDFGRPACR